MKNNINSGMPHIPGLPKRFYMPGLARFLTRVRELEWLGGEHPYGYAFDNPISYVDPSGLQADGVRNYFDHIFPAWNGVPNWIVPDDHRLRCVKDFNYITYEYGNCCGFNKKCNPTSKTFDCLDASCRKHDNCLATAFEFFDFTRQISCNRSFCNDIHYCYSRNCVGSVIDKKQCQALFEVGTFYCSIVGIGGPPGFS